MDNYYGCRKSLVRRNFINQFGYWRIGGNNVAKEKNASLLIIDEIKGRQYAKQLNINIIGLVGILVQAKQEGIIDSVKETLEELKTKAGFWISKSLLETALNLSLENGLKKR